MSCSKKTQNHQKHSPSGRVLCQKLCLFRYFECADKGKKSIVVLMNMVVHLSMTGGGYCRGALERLRNVNDTDLRGRTDR
jgi:hypothetical protein